MKAYELAEALTLHAAWRRGELHGVRFMPIGVNLSGADLHGVDLSVADLRGANLSGVNLSGADLRSADLRGVDLRGADLRDADLDGAVLSYANLLGADLRGADLRDAVLSEALGLRWAAIGPVGQGRRMLHGWHDGSQIVLGGGCWMGTLNDLRGVLADVEHDPPWDYRYAPLADSLRWRDEVLAAAESIVARIEGPA